MQVGSYAQVGRRRQRRRRRCKTSHWRLGARSRKGHVRVVMPSQAPNECRAARPRIYRVLCACNCRRLGMVFPVLGYQCPSTACGGPMRCQRCSGARRLPSKPLQHAGPQVVWVYLGSRVGVKFDRWRDLCCYVAAGRRNRRSEHSGGRPLRQGCVRGCELRRRRRPRHRCRHRIRRAAGNRPPRGHIRLAVCEPRALMARRGYELTHRGCGRVPPLRLHLDIHRDLQPSRIEVSRCRVARHDHAARRDIASWSSHSRRGVSGCQTPQGAYRCRALWRGAVG